jgi:L-malate glycosyltransferase
MYRLLLIKRIIEDILMFPFILLGRMISLISPLEKEYETFFFFPFYHTGGAEKVHAQIAKACGNLNCIIFFTRKSQNDTFYTLFQETGCTIKDISTYTDNKFLYFINIIYRGIITGYINRQKTLPLVFNGQCNFGYKISPWVRKSVLQVELIHSLNTFSYIRIPFIPFYAKTVMISQKRIEDHYALYNKMHIPPSFKERIIYIPNAVAFNTIDIERKPFHPIRVLFSGRGSVEKRLHLFTAIASGVHQSNQSIVFEIMGNVEEFVEPNKYPFITFHGEQKEAPLINAIYQRSNILLLTSSTEGFPLVIIEAMANACSIISTPVGDIPYHIKPGVNGFLFSSVEDEQKIVTEGIRYILQLAENTGLLKTIAVNNREYAESHFSIQQFNQAYQQLFDQVKNNS